MLNQIEKKLGEKKNLNKEEFEALLSWMKGVKKLNGGEYPNSKKNAMLFGNPISMKGNMVRRGDIIRVNHNRKDRPVLVIRVRKEMVYGLILSTTESSYCMMKANSRFLGDSYITHSLVTTPVNIASKNLLGTYGNPKHLAEVSKAYKDYINQVFRLV